MAVELVQFIPLIPQFENSFFDLRIAVMFLLAEPHFAMTIPLLYGYRSLFRRRVGSFIVVPLIIVFLGGILFYTNQKLFFLIFMAANVYHVNRQSRAFYSLQTSERGISANVYEIALHLAFFAYFGAFLKNEYAIAVIVIAALTIVCTLLAFLMVRKPVNAIKYSASFLQGFAVFLPLALFEDMMTAFAIGISIHYLQYLGISMLVCKKGFGFKFFPLILFLLAYAVLSSAALAGLITDDRVSLIILVPTLLQLLHFYFDGLIWRRSTSEVDEVLLVSFK
ncbi:hypothetical protein N9L23_06330 [Alphaproteobacteria bacterium]|nr:hypothetical protein [Alphaproteobacteria bacterium]